ncbi:transposase [Streptomyces sp. NBS 14/10]|uniref:IS110 family transposase n=1 Tax=Streptomyces sp. NBS 14/10 TaxID=1945643 RepID=UPI0015C5AAD9|nr:transposase [Streptomyces sp. NBS 14/10]KAK1177212.1 transposase [Streptomyces sp. NBS 14/10]
MLAAVGPARTCPDRGLRDRRRHSSEDEHVAAVVTTLGLLVATASFPATAAGYEELHAWAGKFGVVRRAGVEGTGSYGAAQARHLRSCGVTVIGVNRPDRSMRRHRGKTDAVDAEAAARAVISGRATVTPKTGDGADFTAVREPYLRTLRAPAGRPR